MGENIAYTIQYLFTLSPALRLILCYLKINYFMNTFFLAENLPYTFCPVESFAKALT